MQRIMVDLPDPDGPQTTIRSPRMTLRSMPRSTWKSANHLCTPIISTATSLLVVAMPKPSADAGAAAGTGRDCAVDSVIRQGQCSDSDGSIPFHGVIAREGGRPSNPCAIDGTH